MKQMMSSKQGFRTRRRVSGFLDCGRASKDGVGKSYKPYVACLFARIRCIVTFIQRSKGQSITQPWFGI